VTGDGRRVHRVAELVRAHVTELLRDLGDERLSMLVITHITVSDDLGIADLGFRSLVGANDERSQRSLMRAVRHATPRLRRGLAGRLKMKRLPELRFHYDVGQDHARRVEEILHEIEQERPSDDE